MERDFNYDYSNLLRRIDMTQSICNAVVSFTELRRILDKREQQWENVMRELIADNQFYEDEILKLQQRFGIDLHLPNRKAL